MVSTEQILLFRSLFRGRQDVYARYWEKGDKHGYSPAYSFDWTTFNAHRAKGGTLGTFTDKTLKPLTLDVLRDHLEGKQTIGLYPLLPDNSSWFIAADFDKKNWYDDAIRFVATCREHQLPAYLERSKSGKGAHVWLFFTDNYPAYKSRAIMLKLLNLTFNSLGVDDDLSFDRLFPNQDTLTKDGFGNLVALPLQGGATTSDNSVFIDNSSGEPYSDQFAFLTQIQKITHDRLDSLFTQLTNLADTQTTTIKSRGKVKLVLDRHIHIAKDKLTPTLITFLKKELNFFNTEYLIKERLGLSTYKTEKYFKLIEDHTSEICLPRGFLNQLLEFGLTNKLKFVVIDKRQHLPKTIFHSSVKLLPHQKDALTQVGDQESGIIVAPPASGKTILGLWLIAKHQQPSLILVHRQQILEQWVERIQSFLGIAKKDIGIISGRKQKLGKQVTVAMLQSLVRSKEIEEYAKNIGLVIIDECHHIPAKTFRVVISQFNSTYLYGLTATLERKYHDEKLINLYIGNVIATIDPHTVNANLFNSTSIVDLQLRDTALTIPYNAKVDGYEILKKVICYDTARNTQIVTDVKTEVSKSRSILVLTERKEHAHILSLYLQHDCELICLTGDDAAAARKTKLDQIKSGHFQVLIATGQLLGEGFDLPQLDTLFLTFPCSFSGKLTQYIGRIERSTNPRRIYDYRDNQIPYLEGLYKKRLAYYRKRGWL